MNSPYFVAMDLDSPEEVLSLALSLKPYVGGFKIGPRLALRSSEVIKKLSEHAPVFLDCKFHDIPSTVEAAVEAGFECGASFVTVHSSNGVECMKRLASLEARLSKIRPFKILGVTLLTSFSEETLPTHMKKMSPEDLVLSMAADIFESGLSGVVCSGAEVAALRGKYPEALLVTPGIRMSEDSLDDQGRVFSPSEALGRGASLLVVGRPIYKSDSPIDAAKKFQAACLSGDQE